MFFYLGNIFCVYRAAEQYRADSSPGVKYRVQFHEEDATTAK